MEAVPLIRELFARVFQAGIEYRATMIVLGGLAEDRVEQYDLFEDRPRIESFRHAAEAIDAVNARYGKHTVSLATALFMNNRPTDNRAVAPPRRRLILRGETARQRLAFPRWTIKV
jgi:hypothetical protein